MAMIIDFKAGAARIGGGGLRTAGAASAEIVLFPGVRYERMAEEPAPAPRKSPARSSRRKRDQLELED